MFETNFSGHNKIWGSLSPNPFELTVDADHSVKIE